MQKFDHENDSNLAKHIIQNTKRYVSLFEEALDELMPNNDIRVLAFSFYIMIA
jgi:DNA replicative helicase MCM subunit Mcm2 (Cdc46/Mcm family)